MHFCDTLVVFVLFLGLFVDYLLLAAYVPIVGFIVDNARQSTGFVIENWIGYSLPYLEMGLLYCLKALGYLVTIDLSYIICAYFGYLYPLLFGNLLTFASTTLFAWNLDNIYVLFLCRLLQGIGCTLLITSATILTIYRFEAEEQRNFSHGIASLGMFHVYIYLNSVSILFHSLHGI